MPEVNHPHWSFYRYFPSLTHHSTFPPERVMTPAPLTLHKVFFREETSVAAEIPQQAAIVVTTPSTTHIRKPRGEVSWISRGGYNLQDQLGWPAAEYKEIRTFVAHLAKEHLNTRRPWSKQKNDNLKIVFVKAKERYPQLLQYEGNWVVSDFLKIYLKNSSSSHGTG